MCINTVYCVLECQGGNPSWAFFDLIRGNSEKSLSFLRRNFKPRFPPFLLSPDVKSAIRGQLPRFLSPVSLSVVAVRFWLRLCRSGSSWFGRAGSACSLQPSTALVQFSVLRCFRWNRCVVSGDDTRKVVSRII